MMFMEGARREVAGQVSELQGCRFSHVGCWGIGSGDMGAGVVARCQPVGPSV